MIKSPSKIFGITSLNISHAVNSLTEIELTLMASPGYNAQELYDKKDWDDVLPGDSIVKFHHCGQFAARKTACVHCGAPVG